MEYIASSNELRKINYAIKKGKKEIDISLDLGKTLSKIQLNKDEIILPDKTKVKPDKIKDKDKNCYIIKNNKFIKLQFFSKETDKLYKLIPTSFRPILKISATSMHKMPFIEKIKKLKLNGKILDSGTGLGYTAIAASQHAKQVITIEWDPNVIEIAKLNPYSLEIYEKKNIKQINADFTKEVKKFKTNEFDNIILDAGTVHQSGDFFSTNNYKEVYRVLKPNGKLFHYLPQSGIMRGRDYIGEIIKRLKTLDFKNITRDDESSSIEAEK